MIEDLLAHCVALAAYPGALSALALGMLCEAGSAFGFVPERGLRVAMRSALRAVRPRVRGAPALAAAAAILAVVAAVQVAAPFNPVPAAERNTVVAAFALAGAGWFTWGWGWERPGLRPALLLGVQSGWLLAVLLPAVVPETVRPQALGALVIPSLLPLKIACGSLYLACLPPLLQLVPEGAPQGAPGTPGRGAPSAEETSFGAVRALLWLPYCGLFASLFFPPSGEDILGLGRFLALTAGAAALTIALAGNLVRRPPGTTHVLYRRLVLPFAVFTLLVALLTSIAH